MIPYCSQSRLIGQDILLLSLFHLANLGLKPSENSSQGL